MGKALFPAGPPRPRIPAQGQVNARRQEPRMARVDVIGESEAGKILAAPNGLQEERWH